MLRLTFADDDETRRIAAVDLAAQYADLFEGCPFAHYGASGGRVEEPQKTIKLMSWHPVWELLGCETFADFVDWLHYCQAHSLNLANMIGHKCFWANWWADDWNDGLPQRRDTGEIAINSDGIEWAYQSKNPIAPQPLFEDYDAAVSFFGALEELIGSAGEAWYWRFIERCAYSHKYAHVLLGIFSAKVLQKKLHVSKQAILMSVYDAGFDHGIWFPHYRIEDMLDTIRDITGVLEPEKGWSFRQRIFSDGPELFGLKTNVYRERLRTCLDAAVYEWLEACPVDIALVGEVVFVACEGFGNTDTVTILTRKEDREALADWASVGMDRLATFIEVDEFATYARQQPYDCLRAWITFGMDPQLWCYPSFAMAIMSRKCLAPLVSGTPSLPLKQIMNFGYKVLMKDKDADELPFNTTDEYGRDRRPTVAPAVIGDMQQRFDAFVSGNEEQFILHDGAFTHVSNDEHHMMPSIWPRDMVPSGYANMSRTSNLAIPVVALQRGEWQVGITTVLPSERPNMLTHDQFRNIADAVTDSD
jgi:hypothetical protein